MRAFKPALSARIGAVGVLALASSLPFALTASAATPHYQQTLEINGPAGSAFGYAVAIDGQTRAVEEPYANAGDGAVEIYTGPPATWTHRAELTAPDAGTNVHGFGETLAFINDQTLAIGAPYHNGFMGAVYIFTGSGSSWALQTEITDPLSTIYDYFGAALAPHDNGFITDGAESAGGAVYDYAQSGGVWGIEQTIAPADRGASDAFGFSLAVDDGNLVVGSPQHGSGGAVYMYSESKDTWTQRGEFQDPGTSNVDALGTSVAVDGSTAVASAPNSYYAAVGTAYVYRQSGKSWKLTATLTPNDGTVGDGFGYPVAIDGSTILAASSGHNSGAGVAYVFTKGHGNKWNQAQELAPSDPQPGAFFGWPTLTFDGSNILISAPYTTDGTLYWFSPTKH